MKFRLTFQVVTEESAANGEFARHGFVTRNLELPTTRRHAYLPSRPAEFNLRDAIEFLMDRESHGPVEADSSHLSLRCPPRWFNYGGVMDKYGEAITIGLHLPDSITPASAIRVARLLNCYGLPKPSPQPANERDGAS